MAKILECAKVDPSSGCQHVVRGETEEEVFTKAVEHAKEHGIRQVTPELMERVKAKIRDARLRLSPTLCVHASRSYPGGHGTGLTRTTQVRSRASEPRTPLSLSLP
jgi:predicted small metal-binding protein